MVGSTLQETITCPHQTAKGKSSTQKSAKFGKGYVRSLEGRYIIFDPDVKVIRRKKKVQKS